MGINIFKNYLLLKQPGNVSNKIHS